ncbi:MAG: UbiD family decarboxylase [Candidatus Methanofastidiosia archaeon]
MDEKSSLRTLLTTLEHNDLLTRIEKEADPNLVIASIIAELDGRPVMIEKVKGHSMPVVAGICSDRDYFALGLNTEKQNLLQKLSGAFQSTKRPPIVDDAVCKEKIYSNPDLDDLPILTHFTGDGGPYITAGVAVVNDQELGQNMCFHRLMKIGKKKMVARIVKNRGTDTALKNAGGELPIAICIGAPLHVLLAAACSPPPGHDEILIAQGLDKTPLVRCETSDILIPAYTEIVIEGRITDEMSNEGPFVDLTQTPDFIRQQQVVEVDTITTRSDPIYQALLPSSQEHKLLMGMPKEPSIYTKVNSAVKATNVVITTGGCSWLHGIVQIEKHKENDGKIAIEKAFEGHGSMKNCIVVDTDIDIYDEKDVEWALATRFQASKDLVIKTAQPGSSLDPSGIHKEGKKSLTDKMGLDATIPFGAKKEMFKKVRFSHVDISKYLGD